MGGYRQDNFDLDADEAVEKPPKGRWWKVLLGSAAYFIPLIWLWFHIDYPDSFGVHVAAHGKAGLLENWYYSYLLIERHHVLDVVAFVCMWAPIVGFIGWIILPKLKRANFSLYSDDSKGA